MIALVNHEPLVSFYLASVMYVLFQPLIIMTLFSCIPICVLRLKCNRQDSRRMWLGNAVQVQAATVKAPAAGAAALKAAAAPAPPGSIPLTLHSTDDGTTCARTAGCTKADNHPGNFRHQITVVAVEQCLMCSLDSHSAMV